uniref:C-type lectin domain-containing protein n=1 Tax=Branchiostoma floridae TaxID=7739 RepID=C3Z835_BRAFL|eukprot:XP_002595337.1 hypothetical protein BRAFLDRAFT_87574 [Branchiostoma floridae]
MEMWNQIKSSKMFWLLLGSGLLILVLVVTGVILITGFVPEGQGQVENLMSWSGQQNSSTSWSTPLYKKTTSVVVSSTSFSPLSGWQPTGSVTDTHRGNTEILLTTIAPLTTTGLECQRWDSQKPHKHDYIAKKYPSADFTENYCRNPSDWHEVWCFTTARRTRWERCDIPFCGREIREYVSLGCWADACDRAIPTLEGTDPRLDGHNYQSRDNAIEKCYQVALSRGFPMFALQNGGQCLGSADGLYYTYRKYGPSTTCALDGEGGVWGNDVYRIKELNWCEAKPCQHGCCGNQNGGYKCTCPTGWTGQNCQHGPCPDDYQKYHDVCYKVFATRKSFSDSSRTCETAGGTLAMPRAAGINAFLISIVDKNRHADAWIGLHDRKREGRWMWIDGTPSRTGYTAWGPGEPNNQNGKQDCAMYWTANRSLWDDAYCNREEKFICQVKPSAVCISDVIILKITSVFGIMDKVSHVTILF